MLKQTSRRSTSGDSGGYKNALAPLVSSYFTVGFNLGYHVVRLCYDVSCSDDAECSTCLCIVLSLKTSCKMVGRQTDHKQC